MVEICPFCGNDYYSISNPVCHGCGGEIKERMYCPNCGGFHIFTVKEPSVGCWCCNKVYNSWREYDEFKQNGQGPDLKEVNANTKQSSFRYVEKKAKILQVKQESKKPDEEEIMLEKNLTVEKGNMLDEEPAKDIDPSEILNYMEKFSGLLPKLEEKRKYLNKRIRQIEGKISEVEDTILKLEEKRNDLHDEIKQVEEETAKIDKIHSILQGIAGESRPTLTATSEN